MDENIIIVSPEKRYMEGYCAALNSVAGERKYLSVYGGFTPDGTVGFSEFCKRNGYPQLFAVDSATGQVVGWCDIVARTSSPSYVGYLGVGLIDGYRGKGIGTAMIVRALELAYTAGFRLIRLECRESNERAISLYQKLGFRKYRRRSRGLCIEGEYFPVIYMKKRLEREVYA